VRQQKLLGWMIGLVSFAIALAVRWALEGIVVGLPYITFFTAILAAGIFGSVRIGATVLVLSVLSAWYFFIVPSGSFRIEDKRDLIGLAIFVVGGSIELYLINVMNNTIDELYVAQAKSETLFKELQHRVANNLTFVAAMLNQQRHQFEKNSPAATALAASQQRLLMMSQIHRRLYDPAFVDERVSSHLETLGNDLIKAHGVRDISLSVDAEPIVLPLDQLVPLSLIVSELITNCLKHAFKGRHGGTIRLSFKSNQGRSYMLRVEDDGTGMSLYSQPSSGLGRTIIKNLLAQLNGTMQTEGDAGTRVTIRFRAT